MKRMFPRYYRRIKQYNYEVIFIIIASSARAKEFLLVRDATSANKEIYFKY